MEKSFSAGAIDNSSSGNRHECVVLHNLSKLYTTLRFRGMGSWNRAVFSAWNTFIFLWMTLCWNLYYERKNNFLLYVMPRVKIKKYLTAKWIAYALGTLCIIVIPYILSAVFALYVKTPVVPFVENPFRHVFENAFIKTSLLYAVALSLWRGIVSLFVMTFGFVLALYCKNIFVILTGPFMYSILENFVLAILRLERLRLVVAFDPTTVDPKVVSISSFLFGPIVLSIVIGLTAFLLSKKNAIVTI